MNSKLLCVKRIATESKGQAIVEAAVILPILFVIVFGILWFGRVMNVYSTLYRAAHDAAQAYGSNTCGSCGNDVPLNSEVKANVVDPILHAAHLNGRITFTTARVQLNRNSTVIENGTNIVLTYTYPLKLYGITCCPLIPTTLLDGIRISARAQAREEN
jgi:archaellum component FlaF (FlaF/FlaG flagellin family)